MSAPKHRAAGTPTQVAHPRRTAWRTFVEAAIVLLPLLAWAAPEVLEAVAETEVLPEGLRLWAAGAAVTAAGLVGLVARLAAIPAVNAVLERIRVLRLGTGVETEPSPAPDAPVTAGDDVDGPVGEVPPAGTYDGQGSR